jgi:hypothetical protein
MMPIVSLLLLMTLQSCYCSQKSTPLPIEPRLPVVCTPNMFTVDKATNNPVTSNRVTVGFRIRLNGTDFDLISHNLIDYFITCFRQAVFRSTSSSTGRVSDDQYIIRGDDDVTGFLYKEIKNLDGLSVYNIQFGYQQKDPYSQQIFVPPNVQLQTCFGVPDDPANLRSRSYFNASYLIQWEDPRLMYSPKICYYIVSLRFQNEQVTREFQTMDKFYYLSKSDVPRRLVISVYAVNDATCYGQYQNINNCVNKTLRSSYGSSLQIDPARDFVNGANGQLMGVNFALLIFITFSFIFNLLN